MTLLLKKGYSLVGRSTEMIRELIKGKAKQDARAENNQSINTIKTAMDGSNVVNLGAINARKLSHLST